MINNWIGRVFGWSSSDSGASSLLAPLRLTDVPPPPTSIVDSDELEAELSRARRYEHDLAIVVLAARPLTHGGRPGEPPRASVSKLPQMVALLAAVALREVLRRSDVVCYQPAENRFVLALAESDEEDARAAVGRIRTHFRSRMRLRLRAGVARFPTDAYTLEELVSTAAARAARTGAVSGPGAGSGRLEDALLERRARAVATPDSDGRP